MLSVKENVCNMIDSPVRMVKGRVELLEGSALLSSFCYRDALKSVTITRLGDDAKFFGYGVTQKVNVKLIDKDRNINVSTANTLDVSFGAGCDYVYAYPLFHVTEVNRDENTNELSITAYDALNAASKHTTKEIESRNYTIKEYAMLCAKLLDVALNLNGLEEDAAFNVLYENGANFDGTETIREALDAIAEATQTIYYINWNDELAFKRLDLASEAVLEIDKGKYFTLSSKANRRLSGLTHATELGDNVTAALSESGTTQYLRDNPFLDLRDDVGEMLQRGLENVGGLTINQFECKWRGSYLLEIGDKISLETKDGGKAYSYVLDDVLTYDGSLSEETKWSYSSNDSESESNPASLGDAIKQTYARVDKANREIELLASATDSNKESISSLQINTESIAATVTRVEGDIASAVNGVNEDITALTSKVEAAMTAEDVQIKIETELANGVNKVTTSTGFTFNEEGLSVSKSGSEMTTQITENGMIVYRDAEAVLTANNVGVDATNLHATTYLIVGSNSRFENYGSGRTGCFWIGNGG